MNKEKLKEVLETSNKVYIINRPDIHEIVTPGFIKETREKHGMSTLVFSTAIGIREKSLIAFEKGVEPIKAIKVLIYLLNKKPELMELLYKSGYNNV